MNPFAEAISRWGGFYGLAGTASATLAGLLFVAVSLHIDVITNKEASDANGLARQTLTNFLLIVAVSLLFLIPNSTSISLGLTLFCLGLVGCYQEVRVGLQIRPAWKETIALPRNYLIRRLILPAISYLVLVLVALSLFAGQTDGLYWAVVAVILILFNATTSSWALLFHLAVLKQSRKDSSSSGQQ